ncbi:MAG: tRNA 4-thiouridine(8) synthase ThiI [Desulfobacca sp.]|uniref:tRNA 4-thiouridine(8) synthase ThiI n=1 Tax=Desulfobacca sp. TaxID=2067990 RepID=UPI00404B3B39
MTPGKRPGRALGLFSGGLDSMLAGLVLRQQGIDVTGLVWETPFFTAARARVSAAAINLPIRVEDLTDRYISLLYAPTRGFGKWMNPCVDCHLLMVREAGKIMTAEGYDFLFTGEVVGQRPFSQNKGSLHLIVKESGYGDLLLRPLSARLLKMTQPERQGLVDRDRLLNISGRGRKRQLELAAHFGITDYPAPAGGCLLTNPGYAARLRDLVQHLPQAELTRADLELLKHGRQFRLSPTLKVHVGRDQRDNEAMEQLHRPGDLLLKALGYPSPLVLIPRAPRDADLTLPAALCASYSDAPVGAQVVVQVEGHPQIRQLLSQRQHRESFQEFLL